MKKKSAFTEYGGHRLQTSMHIIILQPECFSVQQLLYNSHPRELSMFLLQFWGSFCGLRAVPVIAGIHHKPISTGDVHIVESFAQV